MKMEGFQQPRAKAEETPDRSPESEEMQKIMDVLSPDGVTLMNAVFSAPSYEDFLQGMESFNQLAAAQLDRDDEDRRTALERETLAEREADFTVSLPQGRAMRVERSAKGIVTLSETSLH